MDIIDIHCHLGNILDEGGGGIILRRGVPMARPLDPDGISRLFGYRVQRPMRALYRLGPLSDQAVRAEQRRNYTATLWNLIPNLDRFHVKMAAVMPVAPHVNYHDVAAAAALDQRIVPFGSVDFAAGDEAGQVRRQLESGARGFKIHPILQRIPADDPRVFVALEACPPGTVILLHTGAADYYTGADRCRQRPEYGAIAPVAALCRAFRELRFIAGHAGLRQAEEVMELLAPLDNAYVDTSFQPPGRIRRLLSAFGSERVLYASDWPYGFYGTGIRCVAAACRGGILRRVLYENGAALLSGHEK